MTKDSVFSAFSMLYSLPLASILRHAFFFLILCRYFFCFWIRAVRYVKLTIRRLFKARSMCLLLYRIVSYRIISFGCSSVKTLLPDDDDLICCCLVFGCMHATLLLCMHETSCVFADHFSGPEVVQTEHSVWFVCRDNFRTK